jgi:hypothetical protein
MTKFFTVLAATSALMITPIAAQAAAVQAPQSAARYHAAVGSAGSADEAQGYRGSRGYRGYNGYRGGRGYRRHGHVDAGEVIAGAIILGGIIAVASAASKDRRGDDRRYDDRDYRDRDDQRSQEPRADERSEASGRFDRGAMDVAIESCANAAERRAGDNARVDAITSVSRDGNGWRVEGTLDNRRSGIAGEGFLCGTDSAGQVAFVQIGDDVALAN